MSAIVHAGDGPGADWHVLAIDPAQTRVREDALSVASYSDGWMLTLWVASAERNERGERLYNRGLRTGSPCPAAALRMNIGMDGAVALAGCALAVATLTATVADSREGGEAARLSPSLRGSLESLGDALRAASGGPRPSGQPMAAKARDYNPAAICEAAIRLFSSAAVAYMASEGRCLAHRVATDGQPRAGRAAWAVPPRPGPGHAALARLTGTLRMRDGWPNALALAAAFGGLPEPGPPAGHGPSQDAAGGGAGQSMEATARALARSHGAELTIEEEARPGRSMGRFDAGRPPEPAWHATARAGGLIPAQVAVARDAAIAREEAAAMCCRALRRLRDGNPAPLA